MVSFARGYGFITTGKSVEDPSGPRYFFRANSVVGSVESITVGKMVTFRAAKGRDDRLAAVDVKGAHGEEIAFKRTTNANLNVSAPGRRVGIVAPNPSPKFCFVVDQTNGEQVFVPIPLVSGQQIEYSLEMTSKGAAAVDVTGPMGAPLTRCKPGKVTREDKPKAVPKVHKPKPQYYEDDDDYYDHIDYKYM